MAAHKVLPFQKNGVMDIEDFGGRSLVSFEMGLGKTLVSLHYLRRNPQALPAVVICPASVKYQWESEAMAQIGMRSSILESQTPSYRGVHANSKLLVINYDVLPYWMDFLKRVNPSTIIIDESQYIANRETQRTKAVKELCKGRPHVIALSGTPLVNRPSELWPTLNIVRPDIFKSFWSFAQEFCNPRRTPWGWDYSGASHLDALHKLLRRTCMIRQLKSEVLSELPDKTREVITLPLSEPSEYFFARDDFLNWLKSQGPGKAASAQKAQILTQMGYLKRLSAKLKLKGLVEWINNFLRDTDEKLVVFAVHTKMIEALARRCNAKSVVIDGSVTGLDRKAAVSQFRNDKDTRLIIGNIKAMGTGVDGLQVAQSAAFAELDWRPGDHEQAEARLHRMGQSDKSFIYYFIAHGTIEEHLAEVLQEKQKIISSVLDGGVLPDALNIFDQLLDRMTLGAHRIAS